MKNSEALFLTVLGVLIFGKIIPLLLVATIIIGLAVIIDTAIKENKS